MRVGAGLSADPDVSLATANACTQAQASLGGERPSLVVVFYSLHHRDQGHRIASVIRRMLNPVHVIGCSAESVVGGGTELERTPGLSILAACMPGVTFTPFTEADLPPPDDANETAIAAAVGMTDQWRATLLLADPFSVPMIRLLPALNRAKGSLGGVVVGGMASAGKAAGMNSLILDERLKRSGAVGISLSGPVRVDTVLSQGCRPFGPNLVVTRAKGNLIFELGGQSAIDAVQAAVNTLDAKQRKGLSDGLFMGVAINASKPRLGRDDFLIRNVMGVRPQEGAIAVGDIVPVGATIRLHARDATTAREAREWGCTKVTCRRWTKGGHDGCWRNSALPTPPPITGGSRKEICGVTSTFSYFPTRRAPRLRTDIARATCPPGTQADWERKERTCSGLLPLVEALLFF